MIILSRNEHKKGLNLAKKWKLCRLSLDSYPQVCYIAGSRSLKDQQRRGSFGNPPPSGSAVRERRTKSRTRKEETVLMLKETTSPEITCLVGTLSLRRCVSDS